MSLLPTPATDTVCAPTRREESGENDGRDAAWVRLLTRQGTFADAVKASSQPEYRRLRRGAYEIVSPVVFEGLTRGLEYRRGHRTCALGVTYLESECLDRYEDDVEAVLIHLLRYASVPIHNLEGWIRSRLVRATVDGNRRRRGERGALQRPRIPRWLDRLLGSDRWLRVLALDILTWVGVRSTAGTGLWPYAVWADRKASITGDDRTTEKEVERDVKKVLTMMRRNAPWYENFVERPLGRKQAPPLAGDRSADAFSERPHLALADEHEADEVILTELAGEALRALADRLACGEDRRTVVMEVLETVVGAGGEHHDRAPGAESREDEQVLALLSDQAAIDRVAGEISEILGLPVE